MRQNGIEQNKISVFFETRRVLLNLIEVLFSERNIAKNSSLGHACFVSYEYRKVNMIIRKPFVAKKPFLKMNKGLSLEVL